MYCKNYKTRSKTRKGIKTIYHYCTILKKEITYDFCKGCINKEFKTKNCTKVKNICTKINGHKHKSTKATEISMKTKKIVWERDNHKCIYCHTEVPVNCANSHYIKRSQLGKGIPENIVTACPKCHNQYDFGVNIEWMIEYTREYLNSKYENWNEKIIHYKKN